ncbi:ankyrin repeat domain-containing protein [Nocardia testacea]|uniref:ankyrin repeat domain-containing protein n=1 Tax=Nocardia testacea TaxID=248551 RepID=UPI0033C841B6
MTDLVAAVSWEGAGRVRELLAAGADPDEPDEYGTTPLYRAAVQGDTEAVRLLLAHGADPHRCGGGEDEGLPLCAAACWNHTGVVAALLAAGADPDTPEPPHPQQTGPGTPPLLWAVRNGHRETVELLLAAGADPEIPGTPLTIAAQDGRYGIVRALLAHGADPARTDARGRTALAIATDLASADPVALLARRWAGSDREYTVHRHPAGDGTDVVTLRYGDRGRGGETSMQDGHAAIAELLGHRLGSFDPG